MRNSTASLLSGVIAVALATSFASCTESKWSPTPERLARADATRATDALPSSIAPALPAGVGDGGIGWLTDDSLVVASPSDGALYWYRLGDTSWTRRGALGCGAAGLLNIEVWVTKRGLVWRGFDRAASRMVSGLWQRTRPERCESLVLPPDPWGRPEPLYGTSLDWSWDGDVVELAVGRAVPMRHPPAGGRAVPFLRVWRGRETSQTAPPEMSSVFYRPPPRLEDSTQRVLDDLSVVKWISRDTLAVVDIPRAVSTFWIRSGVQWVPLKDRLRLPLHMDSYRPIVVPPDGQREWGSLLTAGNLTAVQRDRAGRWWIVSPGTRTVSSTPSVFLGSERRGLTVWSPEGGECRWFLDESETGSNIAGVRVSPSGRRAAVRLWNPGRGGLNVSVWDVTEFKC